MGRATSINQINKFRLASLFSGCGGMDLGTIGGFSYLGKTYSRHPIELMYALDNDKDACKVFDENFEHKIVFDDIRNVSSDKIPDIDILTGGFPCQSFSIVAQNPPRLGYKDERGQLFFEMFRIINEKRPKVFVAENVKGILSANNGQALPLIIKTFEKAGYYVTYKVLNSSDYGIPQKRERVFIVGFRDKKAFDNFSYPRARTKTKKVAVKQILESNIEEKYFFSDKAVEGMRRANEKHHQMNKGRAQNINEPCNTVGAHLAKVSLNSTDPVLKVNDRYRMFTPREVARIQSFPEEFELNSSKTKSYKVLGNAVPPVMMWYVTQSIINALKYEKSNTTR